jgi:SAM-dependent methyltransferase
VKSLFLQSESLYRLTLKLRYGRSRASIPAATTLPNAVLQSQAEWRQAAGNARQLQLPLHPSEEKNWDHLAAVEAILSSTPKTGRVLDAGAEIYSNVLPALYVCGYRNLFGMNLSFADPARRGPIRYLPGDITCTGFADDFFDAVSCMSVIEHGVPIEAYFREMYRVLKPGGLLITSTDYYPEPIDTAGKIAHGAPIKIFNRQEIEEMLHQSTKCGLELTGEIDLRRCAGRPIRWDLYDLEYTFLIFTLRKPAASC